ncbi:MAG: dethiobiotin synthase [Bacteroidota bacterium]
MGQTIFITGIGTGIGKTVVSAIVAEALGASYWKPIQAGYADGTDSELVRSLLTNSSSIVHPEVYKLKLPASPHLAARNESIEISLEKIFTAYAQLVSKESSLVVEGPGGLLVPLNEKDFVTDLIKRLNAKVILVSQNYLGSINHSLLTAQVCRQKNIRVLGWIFNDQYMDYEDDIVRWSGFPKLGSIERFDKIDKAVISKEADRIKKNLLQVIQ